MEAEKKCLAKIEPGQRSHFFIHCFLLGGLSTGAWKGIISGAWSSLLLRTENRIAFGRIRSLGWVLTAGNVRCGGWDTHRAWPGRPFGPVTVPVTAAGAKGWWINGSVMSPERCGMKKTSNDVSHMSSDSCMMEKTSIEEDGWINDSFMIPVSLIPNRLMILVT